MEFKPELLDVAITAGVSIGSIALAWLAAWLRGKAKYELFRRVVDILKTACGIAQREVYEKYVKDIKKARDDGKLTDEEQKEAMDRAWVRAKSLLSWKGIMLIIKGWPGATIDSIDEIIKSSIEAEIADTKNEFKALTKMGSNSSVPSKTSSES